MIGPVTYHTDHEPWVIIIRVSSGEQRKDTVEVDKW